MSFQGVKCKMMQLTNKWSSGGGVQEGSKHNAEEKSHGFTKDTVNIRKFLQDFYFENFLLSS